MNPINSSINTGLASKIDEFRWSGNTDNKTHILGVKYSAPDYTITPTPASSYQNIHVVLDTVHASTMTTTHQVLSGPTEVVGRSIPIVEKMGEANRSFSSLPQTSFKPSEQTSYKQNEFSGLDLSMRAIPDMVDPEQPGARCDEALTSLKSEIAPMTYPMVPLEETDELAERTDRELPASVDLALVDESADYVRSYPTKEWALMEEEERSWRMSRPIDAIWSGRWHEVGLELLSFGLALDDLSAWTEELKLNLKREVRDIVARINTPMPEINKIKQAEFELDQALDKYLAIDISALEEEERAWRMSRGVDAVLYGKWHQVGLELKNLVGLSWSEWLDNLKNKSKIVANKAINKLEHMEMPTVTLPSMPEVTLPSMPSMPSVSLPTVTLPDLKLGVIKSEAIRGMYLDSTPIDFSFKSNRVPFEIIQLEEIERSRRLAAGVNPIVYGMWFRTGLELKHKYSLRPTFALAASQLADKAASLADRAVDALGSMVESAQSAIAVAEDSLAAPVVSDFAEHKHLNLFAYTAEKIDFTFKSHRTPAYIIALEEAERADRIKRYDALSHIRWNAFLLANLPKSAITESAFMSAIHSAEHIVAEKTSGLWSNGLFSSIAHSVADTTSNLYVAAKESLHMAEEKGKVMSLTAQEEAERLRRESSKVDPMTAARLGRVQDELMTYTVKSV